jgi:hypothetical protein
METSAMTIEKDGSDQQAEERVNEALIALAQAAFEAQADALPDDIVLQLKAARVEAVAICSKHNQRPSDGANPT